MIDDFHILIIKQSTTEHSPVQSTLLVVWSGALALHRAENMHRFVTQQTPYGRPVKVALKSICSRRYC